MRRVHLTVGVHFDDDLGAAGDGFREPGPRRATNSLIRRVPDDVHAPVAGGRRAGRRVIGTAVVNDDNVGDERGDRTNDAGNGLRRAVGRHDHCNPPKRVLIDGHHRVGAMTW